MENGNIKLNSFNQISSMNFSAHCISKLNPFWVKRKIRLNCFKIANLEPLVVEEVAAPHRYRPDNLNLLCSATGSESLSLSSTYVTFTLIAIDNLNSFCNATGSLSLLLFQPTHNVFNLIIHFHFYQLSLLSSCLILWYKYDNNTIVHIPPIYWRLKFTKIIMRYHPLSLL